MADVAVAVRVRRALRRRERGAVALALGALAALALFAALAPVRDRALDALERAARYWDDRWERRVAHGESLVAAERFAEAAGYLEALDRGFPAPHPKYARGAERERLLAALGAAYAAQGRKRRALDAYARLAAFDPRSFANHYAYARALEAFEEPSAARARYAEVLRIHPSHLPSVEAVVRMALEGGDAAAATATYEAYLDAWRVGWLTLAAGGASVRLPLPADGRFHRLEAALALPAGFAGEARLDAWLYAVPGFGIEVRELRFVPPLRVGVAGRPPARAFRAGFEAPGLEEAAPGVFRAGDEQAALRRPGLALPDGAARVELEVRLLKPVSAALWEQVSGAYRNRVDRAGLERAEARTLAPGGGAG